MNWARILGTALVVGALLGPLGVVLLQRVPDRVDRAMTNDRTNARPHPVALLTVSGAVASRLVPLWRVGAGDYSLAEQIDVLLATYGTHPEIVRAELQIGTCVFRLAAPVTLEDGAVVTLERERPCIDDSSPTAEFLVTARGEGRIAWWTWDVPLAQTAQGDGLTLTSPGEGTTARSMVRGRLRWMRDTHGPRRGALVAWLWGDRDGRSTAVWWGTTASLITLGIWLISSPMGIGGVKRAGIGSGIVAFGVATAWALVVPPLQAADEPDHLMSAAEVVEAAHVAALLPEFARRTHFERIRFHGDERFAPIHRDAPFPVAWTGEVKSESMDNRSPVSALMWTGASPFWVRTTVAETLWNLRILHALVFGVVTGVSVALVVWAATATSGAWLLLGIVLMPALSYFGTMVSDWAPLSSWSVLLGAALLMLIHSRDRAAWSALPLGLSLALLLGTSMAGFTTLPLVAAALVGYLCIGGDRRQPNVFWGGVAAGTLLAWWLLVDVAAVGYQRYDAAQRPTFLSLLGVANSGLAGFGKAPWLLLLGIGLAWRLDRWLQGLRSHIGLSRIGKSIAVVAAAVMSLGACLQLVLSLAWRLPQLPGIEQGPVLSNLERMGQGVLTLLSSARLTHFDPATFTSLWGGFGWLDVALPPALFAPIVMFLSAGLYVTWRHFSHRARGMTMAVVAGGILSAALGVASIVLMQRNVHGRYLLPVVVPVVMVVASATGQWLAGRRAGWRWAVCVALAAVHGVSLACVALRYV